MINRRNRDKQELMLLIMECINQQQKRKGATKADIEWRCDINFYSVKQTMHLLIDQRFVIVDEGRYYLTESGVKTWKRLKESLAMVGFIPHLREPRFANGNNEGNTTKTNGNRTS